MTSREKPLDAVSQLVANRWKRLAATLHRECPELETEPVANALRWRRGKGPFRTLDARHVRRFANAAERTEYAGKTYFDEATGTLHLVDKDTLIHVRSDARIAYLSPMECCLTASLAEIEAETASRLLAGPTTQLARWFGLALGTVVLDMAVSRLKRSLLETGVFDPERNGFDPTAARAQVGEDFRFSSVGPAVRFRCQGSGDAHTKLSQLPQGSVLEGLSALILESGAFVDERDYIVERRVLTQVREIFGPPFRKPDEQGPTLAVRSARRIPLRFIEDGKRPGRMNRLLAAAELRRALGPLAEIGERLWRSIQ